MANIYWSWMFSNEDSATLTNLGFVQSNVFDHGGSDYLYSFLGDKLRTDGIRKSLRIYHSGYLQFPSNILTTSGSVSIPIYDSADCGTNKTIIKVTGNSSGTDRIFEIVGKDSATLSLEIDGVEKETVSHSTGLKHTFLTLKYDMSTNPWSAQIFVNGSGSGITHTEALTAATNPRFQIEGPRDFKNRYISQVAIFSDWENTETISYVGRLNPSADTSESGSWVPSIGSDNFAVVSGSFDTTQYCRNLTSSIGQNVVLQVSGTGGYAGQLGINPATVYGVTAHCWASGSGQNAFTAVSDNNSNWTSGDSITPSFDATYGFGSAAAKPSDSTPWTSGSNIYIKYEVG